MQLELQQIQQMQCMQQIQQIQQMAMPHSRHWPQQSMAMLTTMMALAKDLFDDNTSRIPGMTNDM